MSKESEKPAAPAEGAAPPPKSGKKTILVVAVLMAVEAGAVIGVMSLTGPKSAEAEAHTIEGESKDDGETAVEIPLIGERFQNLQTGRVWIWDCEIVLKVKNKNRPFVERVLEQQAAEIQEGLSTIFRKAQHVHLKEAGLETINRQVAAFMSHTLEKDADGKERVERVMIPKCKGFPAD